MDRKKNNSEQTQSKHNKQFIKKIDGANKKYQEILQKREKIDSIHFQFAPLQDHSSLLIQLNQVILPYGTQNPINFSLYKGEKYALIGDNGIGKSVLLKVIAELLKIKSGETWATKSIKYIDQHLSFLNQELSASENFELHVPNLTETTYRNRLSQIALRKDKALYPIKYLSGGEQLKVALCILFNGIESPSLLLLDEPDNHLDNESKKLLIDALNQYQGGMIIVSHRKDFLDQLNLTDHVKLK